MPIYIDPVTKQEGAKRLVVQNASQKRRLSTQPNPDTQRQETGVIPGQPCPGIGDIPGKTKGRSSDSHEQKALLTLEHE